MQREPRLVATAVPERPQGAVLVIHGGANRRRQMRVSPTQLSVLRMIPIARRLARVAPGRLAVFRLLNTYRGWDTTHTPVDDVRWALGELEARLGALPACLVGHSLGGRAALLAAGDDRVRAAVALNPWVRPGDGAGPATGCRILIVHGARDRVAAPERSAAVARELARTADVRYELVPDGRHAMLRHHRQFGRLTDDFVAETMG